MIRCRFTRSTPEGVGGFWDPGVRRHPGGTKEAPRRHPRKHPGAKWEQNCSKQLLKKQVVLITEFSVQVSWVCLDLFFATFTCACVPNTIFCHSQLLSLISVLYVLQNNKEMGLICISIRLFSTCTFCFKHFMSIDRLVSQHKWYCYCLANKQQL